MDNKTILQERIKKILDARGIDKTHYQFYMNNIQPEFIPIQDQITDENILNCIIAKELFWRLGDALLNYVKWEKEQY